MPRADSPLQPPGEAGREVPPTPGQEAVGRLLRLTLPLGHSYLSVPRTGDPSSNRAPGARANTRGIRRICFATFLMAEIKAASPAIKQGQVTANGEDN